MSHPDPTRTYEDDEFETNKMNEITDIKKWLGKVKMILSPLEKKERELLLMRTGILTGEARTLEEVGKHFGVTRERIRQIEAKGLEKIQQVVKGIEL